MEKIRGWTQRHLNWSLILGIGVLGVVCLPLEIWLAGGGSIMWGVWVVGLIHLGLYCTIFENVLSDKGHKMNVGWFVLCLTGGVGIVVLLLLKNKNTGP